MFLNVFGRTHCDPCLIICVILIGWHYKTLLATLWLLLSLGLHDVWQQWQKKVYISWGLNPNEGYSSVKRRSDILLQTDNLYLLQGCLEKLKAFAFHNITFQGEQEHFKMKISKIVDKGEYPVDQILITMRQRYIRKNCHFGCTFWKIKGLLWNLKLLNNASLFICREIYRIHKFTKLIPSSLADDISSKYSVNSSDSWK